MGTKIHRDDHYIMLSQSQYVEKILKMFEHFDLSTMSIMYDSKVHLVKNIGYSASQVKYA